MRERRELALRQGCVGDGTDARVLSVHLSTEALPRLALQKCQRPTTIVSGLQQAGRHGVVELVRWTSWCGGGGGGGNATMRWRIVVSGTGVAAVVALACLMFQA